MRRGAGALQRGAGASGLSTARVRLVSLLTWDGRGRCNLEGRNPLAHGSAVLRIAARPSRGLRSVERPSRPWVWVLRSKNFRMCFRNRKNESPAVGILALQHASICVTEPSNFAAGNRFVRNGITFYQPGDSLHKNMSLLGEPFGEKNNRSPELLLSKKFQTCLL